MKRELICLMVMTCCCVFLSCGEYKSISVCQRAQKVRMKTIIIMCEDWENKDCPWACPCPCMDRKGDFLLLIDVRGLPILNESPCMVDYPCEGLAEEDAEACLEGPDTCSEDWARGFGEDFSYGGIRLCGEHSPITEPFPLENCVYSSEWRGLDDI